MPIKKGPYGTIRHYSSSTGKYVKEDLLGCITVPKKKKHSLKERKEISKENKRKALESKARKSKDPYLYDLYRDIDSFLPNTIIDINKNIFDDKTHNLITDFDIVTKNAIIEIKSGKAKGYSSQFTIQNEIEKKLKKKYLIYAPNMNERSYNENINQGFIILRTKKEIIEKLLELEDIKNV